MSFNIKDLELKLKNRADNITSPYAFYIFITEDEYQDLLRTWASYEERIYNYPLCHIKLLTETYTRESVYSDDWKKPRDITLNKLGKSYSSKILWNESFIRALEKSNLRLIKERENEKEKIYYKNLILHSGVTGSHFEILLSKIGSIYKELNSKDDITIDKLSNLSFSKDFEAKFSKYFLYAFNDSVNKKSLFLWFLELIKIDKNIIENEIDISKINLNSKEIPSSFFIHLKTRYGNKIKQTKIIKRNYSNRFIFEDGTIKLYLKNTNDLKEKVFVTCESNNVISWEKEIEHSSDIKINPDDIKKNIKISSNKELYKLDQDFFLFDDNFTLISKDITEIRLKNYLTILSKDALNIDGLTQIEDLNDDWFEWYHYEVEHKIKLPYPYEKLNLIFEKIKGKWEINSNYLSNTNGIDIFVGNKSPLFIFETEEDISSYEIRYSFNSKEYYTSPKKIKNNYVWYCEDIDYIEEEYFIKLDLIDSKLNVIEDIAQCLWYPNLNVETIPDNLILDSESCNVKITSKNSIEFIKSIPKMDLNFEKESNKLSFFFKEKPEYTTPHLIFKTIKSDSLNLEFKLPYLSVWISSNLNKNLNWNTYKHFNKEELEEIYKKDVYVRFFFYYHGKKSEILSLEGYKNNIVDNIKNFCFSSKNIKFSVSYGDLKAYDEVLINYPNNRKAILFTKKIDLEFWSFEKVNSIFKDKLLFKGIYWK